MAPFGEGIAASSPAYVLIAGPPDKIPFELDHLVRGRFLRPIRTVPRVLEVLVHHGWITGASSMLVGGSPEVGQNRSRHGLVRDRRPLHLFVLVLAYSRKCWAELVLDLSAYSLRRSLVRAAAYFGGVARQWLSDNPRIIVLEREGDAVRFHPRICLTGYNKAARPRPRPHRCSGSPQPMRWWKGARVRKDMPPIDRAQGFLGSGHACDARAARDMAAPPLLVRAVQTGRVAPRVLLVYLSGILQNLRTTSQPPRSPRLQCRKSSAGCRHFPRQNKARRPRPPRNATGMQSA